MLKASWHPFMILSHLPVHSCTLPSLRYGKECLCPWERAGKRLTGVNQISKSSSQGSQYSYRGVSVRKLQHKTRNRSRRPECIERWGIYTATHFPSLTPGLSLGPPALRTPGCPLCLESLALPPCQRDKAHSQVPS